MQQKLKRALSFLCLFLAILIIRSGAFSDGTFTIIRVGNIHPYAENTFRILSPESGNLTIRIHDTICTYRSISQQIVSGETSICWDGCGYNQEKLYAKSYTITAVLEADSGATYTDSFQSPIDYPVQHLLYALPSDDHLYLDDVDSWFLEFRTVSSGTLVMELADESQPTGVFSFRFASTGGKILRRKFSEIAGSVVPTPGEYQAVVYEVSRLDEKTSFSLTVSDRSPEAMPVLPTGEIMPDRSMSESEIWNIMMMPSVVVDIDFFRHQQVFSAPDPSSPSLGTLHGQTQGLNVISVSEDWAQVGAWNHEDGSYVEGWVPLSKLKVVYPQDEYGILIDKQKQLMYIYRKGKVIDQLLVSTGRPDRRRMYQETSAGCFLTGYHRVNFSTNGKKYDYVIQYDGGNLLHQIPYDWGTQKKDFTLGRGYLGAKASHACIRIQADPGANGLNAYWLFTHIPYHTRVIILDDPEERTAEAERLSRAEGSSVPSDSIRFTDDDEMPDEDVVVITFGGQLASGGTPSFNARKESLAGVVTSKGYDYPLSEISSLFDHDDLTCVLWSGALGTLQQAEQTNLRDIQAIAGAEKILDNSSIELLQLGGSSAGEKQQGYAFPSFPETIFPEETAVFHLKGHIIGFACCTQDTYLKNPAIVDQLVNQLRETGSEIVIMLCDWGEKNAHTHSIVQEAMAHRCVRAGADLVIGQHRNTVQGTDLIEGVPVLYGLGNLLDGSTSSVSSRNSGLIAQATLRFNGTKATAGIRLIPVLPYGRGHAGKNLYCPSAAKDFQEAINVIERIWEDSTLRSFTGISFPAYLER